MYNNSYSQSKFGASAKKIHKARGKSCGYYMKIVFFFSSLIQTLIIVSLVLFLVYGQPEESAAEKRLQVLDPMHNELITKHGYLQEEFRNLTWKMNVTNRDMEYMQRNITVLRQLSNSSYSFISELRNKLLQCQRSSQPCNCPRVLQPPPTPCNSNGQLNGLQYENSQLKRWQEILQRNCSETFQVLKVELDGANRDRESLRLETITLRQEKVTAEREIERFKRTCKEDFIRSMEGIPEITKAFRQKIDTLIPQMIPFHITCSKQREQLEQIQYNCSSLSSEVENKFQPYLNDLGHKVSDIVHKVSHLEAKKASLDRNLFECKKNLSSLEENSYKNLRDTRERHDKFMEEALLEQRKLRGAKELLEGTLKLKESEINMLKEKINVSLASSGHKPPGGVGIGTYGSGSTFPVQSGSGIKPTARGSGGPDSSLFKKPDFGRSSVNQVGSGGTGMGNTGSSSLPSSDRFPTGAGSSTPGSGSGTGIGSSRMGSTGTGLNTGSFGTGAGAGHSGTGWGAGGTGFGNTGFGGAGGSRSAFPSAGTGTTGLGNTGYGGAGGAGGSRSAFPGAGTGTTGLGNTGYGGVGSSRTSQSGTGFGGTGFGGHGSAGTGYTNAFGRGGSYGTADPIENFLRKLHRSFNPEQY